MRQQLGYSASAVISMLLQRADKLNFAVMSPASLKTKLSRWENGHEQVGLRRVPAAVPGHLRPHQRGTRLPAGRRDDDEAEELDRATHDRAHSGRGHGRAVPAAGRAARHVDRQFGGVTVLDQLRSNIAQIENLLGYSTLRGQREALAGVLTEASALAGLGGARPQRHPAGVGPPRAREDRARGRPTRRCCSRTRLAQQAFILIDLGELDAGRRAARARPAPSPSDGAPALLRAWLAAAHGEGLAAAGHRDEALRAFDAADEPAARPTRWTRPCRSCSSPARTSTAGAATP